MPATSIMTVTRCLLLDRVTYLVLPWAWGGFTFVLDVVIMQFTPADGATQRWVGGLASVFCVVFVLGVQAAARMLPFGLALGIGRRTYFLGATLLAVCLGTGFGLVIALGQVLERATGGWGLNIAYFRVPYLLGGSWSSSWLTGAVLMILMFVHGLWFGLVYRRGGVLGTAAFGGAQLSALALAAIAATSLHAWPAVGRFFAALTGPDLAMLLAAAVLVVLAGGLATIRRLTV